MTTESITNRAAAVPAIRVADLRVRYSGRTVLDDVSLEVYPNHLLALIGPSGCGKTTFLSCLNRLTDLVPGATVEGEVTLGGESLYRRGVDPVLIRRRIGMIFQTPNPFPFSIRENLAFPLRLLGNPRRSVIDDRMEEVLVAVGLWEEVRTRLGAPALGLSGGQQQRLCMARALMSEPEVLLLDEPCSALDPVSCTTVERSILALKRRCTLIMVTHNIGQARRLSDRSALFWYRDGCGTILEEGPTDLLFQQPKQKMTAAYIAGEVA